MSNTPLQGYRIIAGEHTEKGITYKQNQVVYSHRALDKIFKSKFAPVVHVAPPVVAAPTVPAEPPRIAQEPSKPDTPPKARLRAKHRGGPNWDVVDLDTGKPINNAYLTKDEAAAIAGAIDEAEEATAPAPEPAPVEEQEQEQEAEAPAPARIKKKKRKHVED